MVSVFLNENKFLQENRDLKEIRLWEQGGRKLVGITKGAHKYLRPTVTIISKNMKPTTAYVTHELVNETTALWSVIFIELHIVKVLKLVLT